MSYLDEYRKKLVKASNIIKLIDTRYEGMEYDYLLEALLVIEDVQDSITKTLIIQDDKEKTEKEYPDISDIKDDISDTVLEEQNK